MKTTLLMFLLALTAAATASAATKTLTVLGNQRVVTNWDGDMPATMKDRGIETDVTGITLQNGKLVPTFGFTCRTREKVTKVVVEDVTGPTALLMVEDLKPALVKDRWVGNSAERKITPQEIPWLFASGDSLQVFRFTVSLQSGGRPVVIYQPSVIRESSKARLRLLAPAKRR